MLPLARELIGIFARSCCCRRIFDFSGFNATQITPEVVKEASFEFGRYWDVVDPGNTGAGEFP